MISQEDTILISVMLNDPQAKIQRNSEILSTSLDGEAVLLALDGETYFGMNKVSTRIWELIDSPLTMTELCDRLMQEYEVERSECLAEVSALIEKLLDAGLVETV